MRWRRLGYVLAGLLVLLLAGDFAYWTWTANRLRDGIGAFIAARTAEGWRIQSGPLRLTGWPGAAVAHLPDLSLDYDPARRPGTFPVPVRITSSDLSLSVALIQPTSLTLHLNGEQRIDVAGNPPLLVNADRMEAEVPLTAARPQDVAFGARAVRMEPADHGWATRIGTLDGEASLQEPQSTPQAMVFTTSAAEITLPERGKYPLGRSIANVSVTGQLNGPFIEGRGLAASATAWRDGGGSLEIKQAALEWGPLWMTSTATLALDDQLQPMGSGSAKVRGYAEALDRLAGAGVLTKSAATVAKAMLSLLVGTGTGDAPSEVEVPLTLQYRTLSMRQIPLVRLPELDWPSP